MGDPINSTQVKFVPFKCPVCNGFKTVSFKKIPCSTCHGKGIVIVNQETGEIKEEAHG